MNDYIFNKMPVFGFEKCGINLAGVLKDVKKLWLK
jgi:hypothetical protein